MSRQARFFHRLFLYLLTGGGLLASGAVSAQQCIIVSDSFSCINNFVNYSVQVNGGVANAWAWNLDDLQNSLQSNPSATYSQPGIKNIQVVVQTNNGGSCTAQKQLRVYPEPKADFLLPATNDYCRYDNQVCLQDLSTRSAANIPLEKRLILWGDGKAVVENGGGWDPSVCENYNRVGPYQIVLEVTDQKGCISRTSKQINILPDVETDMRYRVLCDFSDCSKTLVCFTNYTIADSSKVNYRWDFGDGNVDNTSWSGTCHTYTATGVFSAALIVSNVHGCVDSAKADSLVDRRPIVLDPYLSGQTACRLENLPVGDRDSTKLAYRWYGWRQGQADTPVVSGGNPSSVKFDMPGTYQLWLEADRTCCSKRTYVDTVRIFGPVPKIEGRNLSSCVAGVDTTYFCDASDYTNTYGVKRYWDFGDDQAMACTTDTRNGLNIGKRCRFSKDEIGKYIYLRDTCYTATLFLEDTVTACTAYTTQNIFIGDTDTSGYNFRYKNQKACTGLSVTRRFEFLLDGYCGYYAINPDSTAGDNFIDYLKAWNYDSLSNDSGDITVGLILQSGDTGSFCPGTTSLPVCRDTFWMHNWYDIIPEPDPEFTLTSNEVCYPFITTIEIKDTTDPYFTKATIDWGDGTVDSAVKALGDTLFKHYRHEYKQTGVYQVMLIMDNVRTCAVAKVGSVPVGHASKIGFETDACKGTCFDFENLSTYNGGGEAYWTDPNRPDHLEKQTWHFPDGSKDFTDQPRYCFPDTGTYSIMLTTIDSMGCHDTARLSVSPGGIRIEIKASKEEILCAEIIQFSDTVINPSNGEVVVDWYWDFGDGTPPSYVQKPYHFFDGIGSYTVRLITRTSRDCIDTNYRTIKVLGPLPSFEFLTDSIGCAPFTVSMKNTSRDVGQWIWFFGDPNGNTLSTDSDSSVSFTYSDPGTYYIKLYGADTLFNPTTGNWQFCSNLYPDSSQGQQVRKVVVLPPNKADFIIPDSVCVDERFQIESRSDTIFKTHVWIFHTGDSVSTDQTTITHVYPSAGVFPIGYVPKYQPDSTSRFCPDSVGKLIVVEDVNAQFSIDNSRSTESEFFFINQSQNGVRYEWDFGQPSSGNKNSSTLENPSHVYHPDTGEFEICLTAISSLGCTDTFCLKVIASNSQYIFIPNVFTPGEQDGVNDFFDIDINGEEAYHLEIYNRHSQLVFESSVDDLNWGGLGPNGEPVVAGVYYVVFTYKFPYGESVRYTGTVTLIR